MAVASMILGIIALVVAVFGGAFNWLGILIGVIGIVLGAVAKKTNPSGMATAGIVMSIIAASLALLFWLACAACVAGTESALEGLI